MFTLPSLRPVPPDFSIHPPSHSQFPCCRFMDLCPHSWMPRSLFGPLQKENGCLEHLACLWTKTSLSCSQPPSRDFPRGADQATGELVLFLRRPLAEGLIHCLGRAVSVPRLCRETEIGGREGARLKWGRRVGKLARRGSGAGHCAFLILMQILGSSEASLLGLCALVCICGPVKQLLLPSNLGSGGTVKRILKCTRERASYI